MRACLPPVHPQSWPSPRLSDASQPPIILSVFAYRHAPEENLCPVLQMPPFGSGHGYADDPWPCPSPCGLLVGASRHARQGLLAVERNTAQPPAGGVLLTVLTFATRLYRLSEPVLRWDEGWSLAHASLPWPELWAIGRQEREKPRRSTIVCPFPGPIVSYSVVQVQESTSWGTPTQKCLHPIMHL